MAITKSVWEQNEAKQAPRAWPGAKPRRPGIGEPWLLGKPTVPDLGGGTSDTPHTPKKPAGLASHHFSGWKLPQLGSEACRDLTSRGACSDA